MAANLTMFQTLDIPLPDKVYFANKTVYSFSLKLPVTAQIIDLVQDNESGPQLLTGVANVITSGGAGRTKSVRFRIVTAATMNVLNETGSEYEYVGKLDHYGTACYVFRVVFSNVNTSRPKGSKRN